MKLLLILLNLVAAVGLYVLGSVAEAEENAQAYSIYQELKIQHVLVERSDYDVEHRLRTISDRGLNALSLAEIGAGICLVNAIAVGFFLKKPKPASNSH